MVGHLDLRKKWKDYWEGKSHKEVPPIPLVPKDDPTTLFTGSGMQQLVPYLLGQEHPLGKRLYNIQPVLRAQDIEEVGNNRHDTFFEMMGNWSLGDYFKKEQLEWYWKFLTEELQLPKEKLYVTVFEGYKNLPADEESYEVWKKLGVKEDRIFKYGPEKNWWSRAGVPDNMPAGEPGGPDSEVFYEFTQVKHDQKFGKVCHPNCDCGRFLEIGNSVFMQYQKQKRGSFYELPKKNVDFGGGLERLLASLNDNPDQFTTDLYETIINTIEEHTDKKYSEEINKPLMRIIADHMKAAAFLMFEGLKPSNKEQGYILRRLLRRSAVKIHKLRGGLTPVPGFQAICRSALRIYDLDSNELINNIIEQEMEQFSRSLDRGLKEFQKASKDQLNALFAFNLFQSYGFPYEITKELFEQKGVGLNKEEFDHIFERHRILSRTASSKKFKGGLADQSGQTVKYHTATHLLHQALFDVFGNDVRQEGSNITAERLRFDFSAPRKLTDEEIKKVDKIINDRVNDRLPVSHKIIPKEEADKIGARAFFKEKYADMVKVYFIGDYSKEFCGGPHVGNTKEVGKISIFKFEKIGSNLYRIYAK